MKKYKLDELKHANNRKTLNTKLDIDQSGKLVSKRVYRGIIGSLMYLTTCKQDVIFSVCQYVRFQGAYKESHLVDAKRIFRYLVGTKDIRMVPQR